MLEMNEDDKMTKNHSQIMLLKAKSKEKKAQKGITLIVFHP
jgi:hypothetical protein